MSDSPTSYLVDTGRLKDSDIDLAKVALTFAVIAHPGIVAERYEHHLSKIATDVGARYQDLLKNGAEDTAQTRLAALKHVIADQEGYTGDLETYDDLQNADLIRVIDRRKGLPITLAILYLHAARHNNFAVDGVNFPGHFLCRIEHKGVRLIFDPFSRCEIMEAHQLRELIKQVQGPSAELSTAYYETASNREILMRLQNNLKHRMIEAEEYGEALKIVELMRLIDPDEYRLLFDAGVLYAKTHKAKPAIEALEMYVQRATDKRDIQDAESILRQLREDAP